MKADRTANRILIVFAACLLLLFALALAMVVGAEVGITNLTGLHISGDFGTATPSFLIDRTTASGAASEVRVATTPITRITSTGLTLPLGNLTLTSGNLTMTAGKQIITPATKITMTAGGTLTPVSTFQPIGAGAAIGFSAITAGTAGQLLIIENQDNQAIVITDTSTTMLSGNITLGQYDTIALISDGTNWIELYTCNN